MERTLPGFTGYSGSFCASALQLRPGGADDRSMTRHQAASLTPEIAEALRMPFVSGGASTRGFHLLDRRDRRNVGTSVVSRWRIALPFDDRLRLG